MTDKALSDRSLVELMQTGLSCQQIYEVISAREIPHPRDIHDLVDAVKALGLATLKMCGEMETQDQRRAVFEGVTAVVGLSLYVGLLADRLGQTPSILAIINAVNSPTWPHFKVDRSMLPPVPSAKCQVPSTQEGG